MIIADLFNRATDLKAHYSDAGVLPRLVLLDGVVDPWTLSLSFVSGQTFFQGLLMLVGGIAAAGLLVGYRTRTMTIILWVILLSIHMRNPLINGSGEPFLRLLVFWSIFLPLGAVWSMDRARSDERTGRAPRLSMRYLSVATAALFLQIAFVYWFTAILKSGDEWRVDGTAIYYALSLDGIATSTGVFLLQFFSVTKAMTFATVLLEAFGPFLLFFPFFTGPVRTIGALSFMSLHFGIWMTMDIGIFPWVSAFCMVCFLPTWFWDRALPWVRGAMMGQGPRDMLRRARERLVAGYRQSPLGRLPLSAAPQAMGFAANGGPQEVPGTQAAAVAQNADRSGSARNGAEDVDGRSLPRRRTSLSVNLLVAFFLVYVFCWNLTTVSSFALPERLVPVGIALGLGQYWGMFAPYPPHDDGWYVIPGNLNGGQQVNLMPITRDDYGLYEVSWEKPRPVTDTYKNEHWRKYMENLWNKDHADQRLHFGRYICREWNSRHFESERLVNFQIVYMLESTLPNYEPSTPESVVTWEHTC